MFAKRTVSSPARDQQGGTKPWRRCLPALLLAIALRVFAVDPVVIDLVTVDGQEQTPPLRGKDRKVPEVQLRPGAHQLEFGFGPPDEKGPPLRLRYRLDGIDKSWREAGGEMHLSLALVNGAGEVLGYHVSPMRGQSEGWNENPAHRRFTQRRESIQVPPGIERLRVVFSSGNWDTRAGASHPTVGLAMIDECRIWVADASGTETNIWPNSSFEEGERMDSPTAMPRGWRRGELSGKMARVLTLLLANHGHVLALEDDNPQAGAEWICEVSLAGLVRGGDMATIEWQELHSVGGAGGHTAAYAYVPPGDYVFRVEAFPPQGNASTFETALSVAIPQVFYKRTPFLVFSGLGITAVVAAIARGVTRRNMQRDLERLELQRTLELERARIARDIHDDLGSGLTRVALLSRAVRSSVDPNSPTAEDLDHIHQTSQEMTRALDEIVWAVDPAHDSLDSIANYLGQFAQEFLSAAGIECRLDIPTELPRYPVSADFRHNLFLALKEVLNNVVRHASAREVNVSLAVAPDAFVLCVQDDGKGFDRTLPGSGTQPSPKGGHGTANLHKRMEQLGGNAQIQSRPGQGTLVRLRLPLRNPPGRGR